MLLLGLENCQLSRIFSACSHLDFYLCFAFKNNELIEHLVEDSIYINISFVPGVID